MSAFAEPVVATAGSTDPSAPLVVLLHGRGSHEGEIIGLAPYLPEGPAYAAVRAPIAEGGGFAWFANRGIGRPIAESLRSTMDWFRAWLDAAASDRPVVLVGFSGGAAFFPKAVFLSDPGQMVGLLADHVLKKANFRQVPAQRLTRQIDGVRIDAPGLRLHARKVVIAAGAHSRALARQAGDRVPLDTERGYHLEWDMAQPRLTRPACPTSRGFYLCPMTGRLRVAGTVELGGLTAPPSPHRLQKLLDGARAIFPDLQEPDRDWMGFRPSMPDSVPVIGPSAHGAEVIHAYGHGHIGLTLAPITAQIVAALVAGKAPPVDMAPYLPSRFS